MNTDQVPQVQLVQAIASEPVPVQDYQQQVDRWNRYQGALDQIQRRCEIEGAVFKRKVRTSYSERRVRNIKQAIAIGLITASIYIAIAGYFVLAESSANIYLPRTWDVDEWLVAQDIAWWGGLMGALVASQIFRGLWNRGPLPENIVFQCKPVIFIDDLYYLQRFVRCMSKERHDPKVKLPELTMTLPQSWIKQNSLLSMMGTMKDIKLQ